MLKEDKIALAKLGKQLEDKYMMYPFMQLNDNTEIVHSEILDNDRVIEKQEWRNGRRARFRLRYLGGKYSSLSF